MSFSVQRILARIRHAAFAAWLWFGPVAQSVKGEISRDEWKRVVTKATVAYVTTKATLSATLHDAEFMASVVVPTALAALTGFLDATMHMHSGAEPVPPDGPVLPDSPLGEKPAETTESR